MWAEKGGLDFDGRAKWDAWTAVKGMKADKVKLNFVKASRHSLQMPQAKCRPPESVAGSLRSLALRAGVLRSPRQGLLQRLKMKHQWRCLVTRTGMDTLCPPFLRQWSAPVLPCAHPRDLGVKLTFIYHSYFRDATTLPVCVSRRVAHTKIPWRE